MKEYLRRLIIAKLKPSIYIVERNSFVGDLIHRKTEYNFLGEYITYNDLENELQVIVPLNSVFLFERSAKEEVKKSVIPYPEHHINLLNSVLQKGHKLNLYERTQILEDGEESEVYQNLVENE